MAALTFKSAFDVLIGDADLGHVVQVAGVRAAQDIFTAESGTPSKRTALATAVLANPAAYQSVWLFVCGVDPTIVAAGVRPTDAQILAAIKAAWSAVAGT